MPKVLREYVISEPVETIAQLKAIDTSTFSGAAISVYVRNRKSTYVLDRTSTQTANDDEIVQPDVGAGRWFKVATNLEDFATNDTSASTTTYTASWDERLTAYKGGMRVYFKPNNTNTGAATLNINSIGARNIVHADQTAVSAGEMLANTYVHLVYNGVTNAFEIVAQSYDQNLQSISTLGTAADKILYTTGINTWAESDISAFGRSLIDDADAAAARATLALGSIATQDANNVTVTGGSISGTTVTVRDNAFTMQDNVDNTKQARFELNGITAGQTRTLTVQDGDGIIAYLSDITTGGAITTQIIHVDKGGNDASADGSLALPYLTIQAAIDDIVDANSTRRYSVKIHPGLYTENITLKPYVSLHGESKETTRISSASAIGISAAGRVEIRNLLIGGAININSSGFASGTVVDLIGCQVNGNITFSGRGAGSDYFQPREVYIVGNVSLTGYTSTLFDTVIVGNLTTATGGTVTNAFGETSETSGRDCYMINYTATATNPALLFSQMFNARIDGNLTVNGDCLVELDTISWPIGTIATTGAPTITRKTTGSTMRVNYTATNYTPVNESVTGHFEGINTTLGAKLNTTLSSANIFVGNGSNVAAGVAMSGDVAIANTGATTVVSADIPDNAFTIRDNADASKKVAFEVSGVDAATTRTLTVQNADGTIALTSDLTNKLDNSLTSANIFVGNATNVATGVAMSGDVAIANTGATTIQNDAITTAKIINKAVTVAKLADGTAGELITWDAAGEADTVGVGTAGQLLTSNGPGLAPTFQNNTALTTALNSANIFVGNSSNVATGVAMSGDVSITNTGATSVVSANIADNAFKLRDNGDPTKEIEFELSALTTGVLRTLTVQDASGTLALTSDLTNKLDNTLLDGRIFVGNTDDEAVGVAVSGDMAIANTGAMTAQPAIITGKAGATVASGDLVLIADVDDSNALKQVTAQDIADLGGGGSGEANVRSINQNSHGLGSADEMVAVRWNGSAYVAATADTPSNAEAVGVALIIDADNFDLYSSGYVSGFTALTANTVYYVPVSAGVLTSTEPSNGNISKPMLITVTTTTGYVVNMRGIEVSDAALVVEGAAKAWVNFNGTGTVSIRSSFNVSSITDHAVGEWSINFTTAMANANYSGHVTVGTGASASQNPFIDAPNASPTTTSYRIRTNQGAGSAFDYDYVQCAFFGE